MLAVVTSRRWPPSGSLSILEDGATRKQGIFGSSHDLVRRGVENQLGYKMVKWIERIEFIESEKQIGKGEGGTNEDDEYFDLLPNI